MNSTPYFNWISYADQHWRAVTRKAYDYTEGGAIREVIIYR